MIGESIEVFRTNVKDKTEAERLKNVLLQRYPNCIINFDLDDCDKILRMEGNIEPAVIELFSRTEGYQVHRLPD